MKAMAMVAHPDDCVIFAYSFMHNHKQFDWTVCYLTYTADHNRAMEFSDFWNKRDVTTRFLGYTDDWTYVEKGQLGFDAKLAQDSIRSVIADQDLILTHDHRGDYGHLHHKFVYDSVCNNHSYVVTFAGIGQGNRRYVLDPRPYSLDEFPQHQDIVAGFHKDSHTNEYWVSEQVEKIL